MTSPRNDRPRSPDPTGPPSGSTSVKEPPDAGSEVDQHVQALISTVDAAARDLRSTQGLEDTLELIVKGAVAAVPGASDAGITLVDRRGEITSRAPTSPVVAELDALQADLQEGPCIDAAFDAEQVTVADVASASERWPAFAPAAAERGIGSIMAVELFSEPGTTGALNLYAAEHGVFDRDAREIAALFGSHAAIALFGAQQTEHLAVRAASRDLIGQAKGALMQRHHDDDQEAFARLVRASNDRRTRLVEVAREVAEAASQGRDLPA
jgi:transcriptional regulator with GAF, ATPase, and Fis domain